MANGSKTQTAPSNGAISGGTPKTTAGVNRKKAKRRAKQAAKQAAEQAHAPRSPSTGYPDTDLADPGQYAEADVDYCTEDDGQTYASRRTNGHYPQSRNNGHGRGRGRPHLPPLSQGPPPPPPPPFSQAALKSVTRSANSKDKIWNTSTQEERENIKEFWLSLGEDERKSLVKIEKEAVLRKMKEQQKHSCSCTVCGRKRTAIEEELEVLYDAYYEELEQYANHQQGPENGAPILPPSQRFGNPLGRLPPDRMPHHHTHHHHFQHRVQELVHDEDEEEEEDEEEDSEEFSEQDYDEEDEEEEINDEEINDEDIDEQITRDSPAADFFNFGNSLTVKGGILTVADDLLKNDGKKFIEMMEQLAERRMQREEQAQYRTDPHLNHSHNHGDLPDEEFDEEEEEEYNVSEGEDYGEDEMDSMTEEQRMEEGRRMFQIFAARMFEQRVLTAYREKVAHERQQKLLEELEEESRLGVQREAKKARDAQKKKEKKAQQKQAKAEEKARKDADRAREEAELKAQEDKKLEDQRRRKEEQKKKKEAEKKAQEDERLRKEAEKQRRLQEQRDKLQEAERKVQEQKAQEKKIRDDAKRKEREEREAKEKEAREKKAHDEKVRRDRDAKAKAEKEAKERTRKEEQAAHAQANQTATPSGKRAVQPVPVALPPGLLPRQPSTVASPQVQIATPALPKAPTPSRQRQASQQGSHGSSPKTPLVVPSLSNSISPTSNVPPTQSTGAPKQLLTKPLPLPASGIPNLQQQQQQQPPNSPLQHLGPSGNFQPPLSGFGSGMSPGLNGFPNQSPLLPGIGQRPPGLNMPMFPMHPPNPLASQYRGFGPGGNLPPPPPGMGGQQMMPAHGQGFPMNIPPGFQAPLPGMGAPMPGPGFRDNLPPHSRQPSGSFDKSPFEAAPGGFPGVNPIQRPVPAPIQRPSSAKPHEDSHQLNSEIDDLSSHLGSKALLDDADDPIPPFHQGDLEPRRSSLQQGQPRMPFGNGQMFATAPTRPRVESFGLGGSSGAGSAWSTPTNPFMSSASSMPSAGGWGSSPTGNRYGFGPVGQSQRSNVSRPVSIRLKAIQAYRDLSATTSSAQRFELNEILHSINLIPSSEAAIHPDELKAILETEGDAINGGGLFHLDDATPGQFIVKYEDGGDIGKGAPGLGEIGSPIPSHSVPVGSFSSGNGFGNPIGNRLFPNLGPS